MLGLLDKVLLLKFMSEPTKQHRVQYSSWLHTVTIPPKTVVMFACILRGYCGNWYVGNIQRVIKEENNPKDHRLKNSMLADEADTLGFFLLLQQAERELKTGKPEISSTYLDK